MYIMPTYAYSCMYVQFIILYDIVITIHIGSYKYTDNIILTPNGITSTEPLESINGINSGLADAELLAISFH